MAYPLECAGHYPIPIKPGKNKITKTNIMPRMPVCKKTNLDQSISEVKVRKIAAMTGPNTVPPPPKKSINIVCKVISTEKADSGSIKKTWIAISPPTAHAKKELMANAPILLTVMLMPRHSAGSSSDFMAKSLSPNFPVDIL